MHKVKEAAFFETSNDDRFFILVELFLYWKRLLIFERAVSKKRVSSGLPFRHKFATD